MQITFFLLYTCLYVVVLWVFLLTAVFFVPIFFLVELPFSITLLFLRYYTPWRVLLLTLFLLLSGLPPVIFFVVKLNIIIYMLSVWDIGLAIAVFCILFLNMLFYLRIFRNKSGWIYLHILFRTNLFSDNITRTNLSYRHLRLPLKLLKSTDASTYEILYLICGVLGFLVFGIFFFSDIFLIMYNLVLS